MMNVTPLSRWMGWAAALVMLLVATGHGGGAPQVQDVPVGDLRATVWTAPDTPRAGQDFHVTVALYRAGQEHDQGVADAQVQVRLLGPAGQVLEAQAELASQTPPVYEADLTLPASGLWQVEVHIQAPAGQGTLTFTVEAQPAASGLPWWLWVALAGGTVAVLGGWWRRRRAATP